MSNRTYVCLECRRSRRAPASDGIGLTLHCADCHQALIKLPVEVRIPTRTDGTGWKELRAFLQELAKGDITSHEPKNPKKAKGIQSVFQLPARKRKAEGRKSGATSR